jgi:hypothetical protein
VPSSRSGSRLDLDPTNDERTVGRRRRRRIAREDEDRPPRGFRCTTLLIADPHRPPRLAAVADGSRLRLLTRLFAFRLDRALASGLPPESDRLLAARAQWLVSASFRRNLALDWAALLARVERPRVIGQARVPVCRDRVAAARDELRAMLDALVAPLPVSARGVATVGLLLRDGRGPLYNRRDPSDLRCALREATAQLDPAVPLARS